MKEQIKVMTKWGVSSFIIYTLTIVLGVLIDSLKIFVVDRDFLEITANIVTNVYGFIAAVQGYGDFFEYSGFYAKPFIIGGVIWIIMGMILSIFLKGKDRSKRLGIISIFLIFFGLTIGVTVTITSFIMTMRGNGFALLYIPYLATIFIPLIIIGTILKLINNINKKKSNKVDFH